MRKLRIDNKWSVEFDPYENDRPKEWYRYDEIVKSPIDNIHVAMFYALLDAHSRINELHSRLNWCETLLKDRDGGKHDSECSQRITPCGCGHDDVQNYLWDGVSSQND